MLKKENGGALYRVDVAEGMLLPPPHPLPMRKLAESKLQNLTYTTN
jgi:hypothetical protein